MIYALEKWTDPTKGLAKFVLDGKPHIYFGSNAPAIYCTDDATVDSLVSDWESIGAVFEKGYPREFTDEEMEEFVEDTTCTNTKPGDCFFDEHECYLFEYVGYKGYGCYHPDVELATNYMNETGIVLTRASASMVAMSLAVAASTMALF